MVEVRTPIIDESTGERAIIGKLPALTEADALEALEAAKNAWDEGQGIWPQMTQVRTSGLPDPRGPFNLLRRMFLRNCYLRQRALQP